jgi:hypothetical protein
MLVARHVVDHKQDYQAQDQQMQPQPHLGAAAAPVTILRNQAKQTASPTSYREARFKELEASLQTSNWKSKRRAHLIPLGSRNYLFSETDAAMLVIS